MTSVQKLANMGCGSAIINSCIDRGSIQAAVNNAKTFLKYYKYAVKSGLYSKEQAIDGLYPYYIKLRDVRNLVDIYSQLWTEKYCKILLEVEKFIGWNNL